MWLLIGTIRCPSGIYQPVCRCRQLGLSVANTKCLQFCLHDMYIKNVALFLINDRCEHSICTKFDVFIMCCIIIIYFLYSI